MCFFITITKLITIPHITKSTHIYPAPSPTPHTDPTNLTEAHRERKIPQI